MRCPQRLQIGLRQSFEIPPVFTFAQLPGESKEAAFRITPGDLKFYNRDLVYDWEPGEFVVRMGANSRQLKSATVHWSKR